MVQVGSRKVPGSDKAIGTSKSSDIGMACYTSMDFGIDMVYGTSRACCADKALTNNHMVFCSMVFAYIDMACGQAMYSTHMALKSSHQAGFLAHYFVHRLDQKSQILKRGCNPKVFIGMEVFTSNCISQVAHNTYTFKVILWNQDIRGILAIWASHSIIKASLGNGIQAIHTHTRDIHR